MLTGKGIIKKIESNKEHIKKFGVHRISLFGSYAHGTAKEGSDLDFLVEYNHDRGNYKDTLDLLEFLQHLLEQEDIDLVQPTLIREELRKSILDGVKIEAKI